MGVSVVGDKKTQRAAQETGLPIFRCLRHSNRLWFGFVREGEGHWHVDIDPVTWEWEIPKDRPYVSTCFTSCSEGMWGPRVDPPETVTKTDRTPSESKA